MRSLAVTLLIIYGLFSSIAGALELSSPFDSCVDGLYKKGGLSLRQSQLDCLEKPSSAVISCQNNLFQKAFREPEDSFDTCKQDANADQFYRSGSLYQGIFTDLPNGGKKTVCTLTVNSTEEGQSFRKLLPAEKYDFVELLPQREDGRFVTRDSFWLQRSCDAQVRCDILLISGHFAESFLGESGFEISMKDLNAFKQKESCGKFFDSIKEVYLFGCNTLAGKNPDSRSLTDYITVLIEDGVAPHSAQRIAARRYTAYDQSVTNKMKGIFSSASFIAGNSSVGPSGKSVQPTLEKYLATAYQDGGDVNSRKILFQKTLGSIGMIETSASETHNSVSLTLLETSKMTSGEQVLKFANQFGSILTVPSIDLLTEAQAKSLLTEAQISEAQKNLQMQWRKLNSLQKRQALCPLMLAGYETWMPADLQPKLQCASQLSWIDPQGN